MREILNTIPVSPAHCPQPICDVTNWGARQRFGVTLPEYQSNHLYDQLVAVPIIARSPYHFPSSIASGERHNLPSHGDVTVPSVAYGPRP